LQKSEDRNMHIFAFSLGKNYRAIAMPLLGSLLLFGVLGCNQQNRTVQEVSPNNSPSPTNQNALSFNNITLEQADEQGRPIWSVKGNQATYSRDQKVAQVQNPTGELFQDGKVVYKVSAQQGEVRQDGKRLFLKGQIIATDPINGVVLRGNEAEWRPQEDLLIVRNQITGKYRQVQAAAQEARVFSRTRIELQGKVVAQATDPALQMRTEHLTWQVKQQKLIGDRAIEIDRYKGKTISDRATANGAEVDLNTKIAKLQPKAQLVSSEPPLQVNSNSLSWNLNAETVTTNQPVKVVHRQQQVTLTANQGRMDLTKEIVYLTGKVYAIGQRQQSLNAQNLTWYVPTQLVEATGDVVYQQVEPPASFTGQKAVGKLQEQNVVVSGGTVVTKIIP
jgi:LPS export ABC transporter protein LptC